MDPVYKIHGICFIPLIIMVLATVIGVSIGSFLGGAFINAYMTYLFLFVGSYYILLGIVGIVICILKKKNQYHQELIDKLKGV